MVDRPGNGRCRIGNGISAVRGGRDEFPGQALLIGGDMGEIIKIAAIGLDLWAPVVVIICPACPNRGNTRTALVGGGARTASAAPPASGRSEDILYRKILFVDVIAFPQANPPTSSALSRIVFSVT